MVEKSFKVMISQPIAGKTEDEIFTAREKARRYINSKGYNFINTLFIDDRYKFENMTNEGIINFPLYYFANSIMNMCKCNIVYFCKGWEDARGCRLEHEIAEAYGLKIIYEE